MTYTIFQSLEALDVGKTFAMAYMGDVRSSAATLRYVAGLTDKIVGQTVPVGK